MVITKLLVFGVSLWILFCSKVMVGDVQDKTSPVRAAPAPFTDIEGRKHHPFAQKKAKAVVFIFVLQDCPIANGYAPEIKRLHKEFQAKKVDFYLVHTDSEIELTDAKRHAKEYDYKMPIVVDAKHSLVKHCGAKFAPEVAVFTPDGRLQYRGRIDDRYTDFGKRRVQPARRDLRDALNAILEGRRVPRPWPAPVGCFIPEIEND